eukprot:TRINITY_DN20929_c0_g1_i1.p1 TRINITY_DN20929_c0_g1~~TRINITY_DN20929_c0_g1_i1.p1  ORF type:complete len:133 (+),score=11.59 TRINITY_DN20929_c0_g1_i1:180-578(+)
MPTVERPKLLPVLPNRVLTTDAGKQALVDSVLRSVNYLWQGQACCHRHSAVRHLSSYLEKLLQQPCDTEFYYYNSWQCCQCGILRSKAPGNDTCGYCAGREPCSPASSGRQAVWHCKVNSTAFCAGTPSIEL